MKSFTIVAAERGGYFVMADEPRDRGLAPSVGFAGALVECLDFIRMEMESARAEVAAEAFAPVTVSRL